MKSSNIRLTIAALSLVLSVGAFAAGNPHGVVPASATMRQTSTMQTRQASTTQAPAATQQVHATGQPNQTCGSATAPNTPGNAASAPGSAFNPDGVSGTKYAGEQPQNSRNPNSVSQYDVACSHQR